MKCIALAIFLVGLFYVDMEMTKKFGTQYEGVGTMVALTLLSLFAFVLALLLEKST